MTHRALPTLALSVGAALLVGSLAACGPVGSHHGATSTATGTVLVSPLVVTGHTVHLLTPDRHVDVVLGDPVTELAPYAVTGSDESYTTDGVFVPVDITVGGRFTGLGLGLPDMPHHDTTVSLRANGQSYPVITTSSGVTEAYVSVPSTDGLQVEVTWDGVTQSADVATGQVDAGVAQPLYDQSDPVEHPYLRCPERWTDDSEAAFIGQCSVTRPETTAYLPGRGWAREGHAFVVVSAGVELETLQKPPESGAFENPRITATLDGASPVARFDHTSDDDPRSSDPSSDVRTTLVFDVASGATPRRLAVTVAALHRRASGAGTRVRLTTAFALHG